MSILTPAIIAHIAQHVAAAPPLSPRQIAGLRAVLIPGERHIIPRAA